MNGDIEPFPGTINILSKYVGVSSDFWYKFNTEETLAEERKAYAELKLKASTEQLSKDFTLFNSLSEDIKQWVVKEENLPYLKAAMEAQQKKVSPNSLQLIIETLVNERSRK